MKNYLMYIFSSFKYVSFEWRTRPNSVLFATKFAVDRMFLALENLNITDF